VGTWFLLPAWASRSWSRSSSVLRKLGLATLCLPRLILLPWRVYCTDIVVIRKELLPIGSGVIERAVSRWRPMAWDIDDAEWLVARAGVFGRIAHWRRGSSKARAIAEAADAVFYGMRVESSVHWQPDTRYAYVPTIPDEAGAIAANERRDIGWIGTPSTWLFAKDVVEHLLPLAEELGTRIQIVGAARSQWRRDWHAVHWSEWSLEAEREFLSTVAVGLYPLPRTEQAEGKGGYKSLLYMRNGIPQVASPIGIVRDIVSPAVGRFADSLAEWEPAVRELLLVPGMWDRMSTSSKQEFAEKWSRRSWYVRVLAPRLEAILVEGPTTTERDNCR
jgi:hypothetical protein